MQTDDSPVLEESRCEAVVNERVGHPGVDRGKRVVQQNSLTSDAAKRVNVKRRAVDRREVVANLGSRVDCASESDPCFLSGRHMRESAVSS